MKLRSSLEKRHIAVSPCEPRATRCQVERRLPRPMGRQLDPAARARRPARARSQRSSPPKRRRAPRTRFRHTRRCARTGPDPVGIPSKGSHASVYTRAAPYLTAGAAGRCGRDGYPPRPGAFEVYPEPKSRACRLELPPGGGRPLTFMGFLTSKNAPRSVSPRSVTGVNRLPKRPPNRAVRGPCSRSSCVTSPSEHCGAVGVQTQLLGMTLLCG